MRANKTSPLVHNKLIEKKSIRPTQSQQKWKSDCNLNNDECINWGEAYILASKCTKSTRLIEFQFKFLHTRITTNDFLHKIGIKSNPKCSFSEKQPDKLKHLFWSCLKVASFWNSLMARLTLSQIISENYIISISVVLGLMPNASKNHLQLIFCYLLARYYIWICKCKETVPIIECFLRYLKTIYEIEVLRSG